MKKKSASQRQRSTDGTSKQSAFETQMEVLEQVFPDEVGCLKSKFTAEEVIPIIKSLFHRERPENASKLYGYLNARKLTSLGMTENEQREFLAKLRLSLNAVRYWSPLYQFYAVDEKSFNALCSLRYLRNYSRLRELNSDIPVQRNKKASATRQLEASQAGEAIPLDLMVSICRQLNSMYDKKQQSSFICDLKSCSDLATLRAMAAPKKAINKNAKSSKTTYKATKKNRSL